MELTIKPAIEIARNHFHKQEFDQASEICRKILQIAQYPPAYHLLGLIELPASRRRCIHLEHLAVLVTTDRKTLFLKTFVQILTINLTLSKDCLIYETSTGGKSSKVFKYSP